jgi:hypothetical protein
MRKINVYFMSLLLGGMAFSSCTKSEVTENESGTSEEISNVVSFQAQLNAPSRAQTQNSMPMIKLEYLQLHLVGLTIKE